MAKKEKVEEALELLRKINENALIVSTNLNVLSDEVLVDCYEAIDDDFEEDLLEEVKTHHHHHHDHDCECGCHDHHHDHDCECGCHDHHHDHDCECGCHDHHHDHDCECGCHEHHHDHDCECGCHEHHHDHDCECGCHDHHHDHDCECGCHDHHHDHDCECGCHDHHHDHDCECGCHEHHHAEEVFTSFGLETAKSYTYDELNAILEEITENDEYGIILRAKGIVDSNNVWYHFDVVPGQIEIREGKAGAISKICVIGTKLNKDLIKSQFLK